MNEFLILGNVAVLPKKVVAAQKTGKMVKDKFVPNGNFILLYDTGEQIEVTGVELEDALKQITEAKANKKD